MRHDLDGKPFDFIIIDDPVMKEFEDYMSRLTSYLFWNGPHPGVMSTTNLDDDVQPDLIVGDQK